MLAAGAAGAHPDLLEQIEHLDAEIAQNSGDATLLLQRGDLHRRHGDFAAAAADFAAARALDPAKPELDFAEGRLLLDSSQSAAAEQSFSRYLDANPQHAAGWNLRGHARLAQGLPELAARDYGRAIDLSDPPGPALFLQQASALVLAGTDDWPAAQQVLQSGLERHPQDVALHGLAADIALAQGEPDAARMEIGRVPAAVQGLSQWQRRIELAACVAAGGADAERCAQQARAQLRAELNRWRHDQPSMRQAVHGD